MWSKCGLPHVARVRSDSMLVHQEWIESLTYCDQAAVPLIFRALGSFVYYIIDHCGTEPYQAWWERKQAREGVEWHRLLPSGPLQPLRLNKGPAVLFLGQDYLSFETGEDPLLREIEVGFGGSLTTPAYHQLLESAAGVASSVPPQATQTTTLPQGSQVS